MVGRVRIHAAVQPDGGRGHRRDQQREEPAVVGGDGEGRGGGQRRQIPPRAVRRGRQDL